MQKYYKLIAFLLVQTLVLSMPASAQALALTDSQNQSSPSSYSVDAFLLSESRADNAVSGQNDLLNLQSGAASILISGRIQTPGGEAIFEAQQEFLSLSLPSGQIWKIDILSQAAYSGNTSGGSWVFLKINPESYTQTVERMLNEAGRLKRFAVSQDELNALNPFISAVESERFTYGTKTYGSSGIQSVRYFDTQNRLRAFSKYNKSTGLLSQINWFASNHLDEIYYFGSDGKLSSLFTFDLRSALETIEDFSYDLLGHLTGSFTWLDEGRSRLSEYSFSSADNTRGITVRVADNGNGIIIEISDLTDDSLDSVLKTHAFQNITDISNSFALDEAVLHEINPALKQLTLTIKKSDGSETKKIFNLITGEEILETDPPAEPHTDVETFKDALNRRYKEIASSYDAEENLLSKIETLYDVNTDAVYQITVYNVETGQASRTSWYSGPTATRAVDFDSSGKAALITVYDHSGNVLQTYDTAYIENNVSLDQWFNDYEGSSGLIASHPDDTSFVYHEGTIADWAKVYGNTQAYTYDQALAGMSFIITGDLENAKKIFDFYLAEFEAAPVFDGFWTVYNTDADFQWKKYEWRKGMGESAWIGLFAMKYFESAADPSEKAKALALATGIGKWISSLQHHNGGVAMGPYDQWVSIYSTENNLDYYALAKILSQKALSPLDRQLFQSESTNLKNWLKNEAYNSSTGLFNRGGQSLPGNGFQWDGLASLDVNSWAIQSIGPQVLADDFGINLNQFVQKVQASFAVQPNDSFGGNIFTARGFDFSDSLNANLVGRSGVKWVEGTNQMIVSYRVLADYYLSIGDLAKAQYYLSLASYFQSRNAENAILVNSSLGFAYADRANLFIYFGNNSWKTTAGQAAPSSAWITFALNNINPLEN